MVVGLPVLGLLGLTAVLRAGEQPYLGAFGALVLGLGLVVAPVLLLERRWDARRPGPVLSRDPADGAPSTFLVRAPWSPALRLAGTVVVAGPLLAAAVVAVLDRQWVWAVVLGALALVVVRASVPLSADPGGVHLSARGLTVLDHGRTRHAAWDDVTRLDVGRTTVVHLRPRGRIAFVPVHLAVHPVLVELAVDVCLRDPALRDELGTPTSLDWPVWRIDR